MLPEEVLAHEPRVLTQAQREFYFENGYLLVEAVVDDDWLARLRAATEEMVDRSRALTRSDRIFDLEPGHSADEPRLRRLTSPVDHHPEYWAFASDSVLPRHHGRPRRARREVPPQQAELQMGQGG